MAPRSAHPTSAAAAIVVRVVAAAHISPHLFVGYSGNGLVHAGVRSALAIKKRRKQIH